MIYACTKRFFIIVLVGTPGDARKSDIFFLNGQLFRSKFTILVKIHFIVRAHQTSSNKNEMVAHPADHGNTHFGPTQQPTYNTAALV
jgi:hypothetical protein